VASSSSTTPPDHTLGIGDTPGAVVPSQLFGINTGWEELGFGIMLDGDFLADRSFRLWGVPDRDVWRPTTPGGSTVTKVSTGGAAPPGAVAYDGYVHVTAGAGEAVLLAQRLIGPLRAGSILTLTFSTRATANAPVMSAVVAQVAPFLAVTDTQYAATVVGPDFVHHNVTLTATADVVDAVLYLAATGPGAVDVDEVRLRRLPASGPLRVDPAVKTWLQTMGVRNILWPGGFAADLLDWHAMVGPVWERPEMVTALHAPETPAFAVAELFALAQELNLDVVLQLNALGSPQDAADFVEYLRGDTATPGGALRAMHGHPAPYDVLFAQLGNEPAEAYSLVTDPTGGDVYAQNSQAIITAVAAVDPTLALSAITEATFQLAPWLPAVPLLAQWNTRAFLGTYGLLNDVPMAHGHYYSVFGQPPTPQDVFPLLMTGGSMFKDLLTTVRGTIGNLAYWVTEFHVTIKDSTDLVDPAYLVDAQAGLGVADIYLSMMQTDVAGAQFFNLSERVGFGALTGAPAWRARPTGHVLAMLSPAGGEPRLVTTLNPAPAMRTVTAVGVIPANQGYALLEAFATRRANGRPRIFLLNRDAQRAVTVDLAPTATWTSAQVTTLASADLTATNETTTTVTPVTTVLVSGQRLTVPAAGLVRLDLE